MFLLLTLSTPPLTWTPLLGTFSSSACLCSFLPRVGGIPGSFSGNHQGGSSPQCPGAFRPAHSGWGGVGLCRPRQSCSSCTAPSSAVSPSPLCPHFHLCSARESGKSPERRREEPFILLPSRHREADVPRPPPLTLHQGSFPLPCLLRDNTLNTDDLT